MKPKIHSLRTQFSSMLIAVDAPGRRLACRGSEVATSPTLGIRSWRMVPVLVLSGLLPQFANAQAVAVSKFTLRQPQADSREVFFRASGSTQSIADSTAMAACQAELRAALSGSATGRRSTCESSSLTEYQAARRDLDRSRRVAMEAP